MESHEWVRAEDGIGTIGITDYVQAEIAEIFRIELPRIGTKLTQGKPFGTVSSMKAIFDLHAPVSGEVIDRNESLMAAPTQVNESPYTDGWLLKVRMTTLTELDTLLDSEQYQAHIRPTDL